MEIAHLLQKAQKEYLRSEMEVFLAYLLDVDRLDLIAYGERELPVEKLAELQQGWNQLLDGYPVAYLIGKKEFFGLDFYVDERVLVPRNATERLVEYILERKPGRILEIGTGSGAISLSVKKNLSEVEIVATDVSDEALEVARRNAKEFGVDVEFIKSDLLESVEGDFDILVANLPYIGEETNHFIAENVEKHEPHVALFGGSDGLRLYEKMFKQAKGRGFKVIMGEFGFTHANDLRKMAAELLPDYKLEIFQDYEGLDRHFILSLDYSFNNT